MNRLAAGVVLLASAALLAGCWNDASRRLSRAKDALYEKDPQRALKEYRLAIDALENDSSPEAQVLRARALRGAADVYYLELRDFPKATEMYRELIQMCPEAPETIEGRIQLADILGDRMHDVRGGINELTAALARNPPQGAELEYKVAKLYFQLGDYPQSELEAQNVIKKYETSGFVVDAMFLMGQALAMEGKRPEASRAFQELVERFPDSNMQPHAYFEMAKLSADSNDEEKAIELYVQALKRHPDPKLVQNNIARLRKRLASTKPTHIGDHATAFDHVVVVAHPHSSVEAAGGTAEEAAHDNGD
jgi:tetratricopeptide (TPR) repeat protein